MKKIIIVAIIAIGITQVKAQSTNNNQTTKQTTTEIKVVKPQKLSVEAISKLTPEEIIKYHQAQQGYIQHAPEVKQVVKPTVDQDALMRKNK